MTGPRIAILGFAHYHANFWAEAIRAHPEAVLASVWAEVLAGAP